MALMYLKYGTYQFPAGGAEVRTDTDYVRSQNGRRVRKRLGVNVRSKLLADGQTALAAAESACRAALEVQYQDLILFRGDGVASSVALLNQPSRSGVQIVRGPNFGEAMSPEFVKTRTVDFRAEAEYDLPGSAGLVIEFRQTVQRVGNGGPSRLWRIPIWPAGASIRQQTKPESMVTYTQVGTAVGYDAYPAPPALVFPANFLVNEADAVTKEWPEPIGQGFVNYRVSWNYRFEIAGDQLGNLLAMGVPFPVM